MNLLDLDAQFVSEAKDVENRESFKFHLDTLNGAQGVMFQCPKCAAGKPIVEEDGKRFVRGAHLVLCWFSNPQGTTPAPDTMTPLPGRWTASGNSLADLTLNPSVFLQGGCGWHGWVKNGDAT
jgi:hypothetical protein